jgi:hypothetical protein
MNEEQQAESYVSQWIGIDEAVAMLNKHSASLRELSRKKREARETIERMRYHLD